MTRALRHSVVCDDQPLRGCESFDDGAPVFRSGSGTSGPTVAVPSGCCSNFGSYGLVLSRSCLYAIAPSIEPPLKTPNAENVLASSSERPLELMRTGLVALLRVPTWRWPTLPTREP